MGFAIFNKKSRTEQLVKRAQKGNRDAFGQLFTEFSGQLLAIMRGHLLTKGLADASVEDICQEAWMVAYKKLETYDSEKAQFLTWLRGIAVNLARNELRKRSNQERPTSDDELKHQAENAHAFEPEADSPTDTQRVLRQVISDLPDTYSAVLISELDGHSPKEIAQIHGIKVDTVYKRLKTGYRLVADRVEKKKELYEELGDAL